MASSLNGTKATSAQLPQRAEQQAEDRATGCGMVDDLCHSSAFLSRRALPTTDTDDSAIAAAAIAGESSKPNQG